MPSPFYRSSTSPGASGPGVTEAGAEGAQLLFEQVKGIVSGMGCTFIPTAADELASAKAAGDAYLSARNGHVAPDQSILGQGSDLPQMQLGDGAVTGMEGCTDIGKAISDLVSKMGDVLNQAITSPVGFLGQLLGFLFKLFTDIAGNISQVLSETARAAAAAIEDAWKKQMELAAAAGTNAGLQPLELFNQAATTQTLSHAMKTSSPST